MKQALVVDDHPIVREGVTDLLQRALDLIDAVKMALRGGPAKKTRQAIVPVLSDREIQVLTHFAKGMSRKEISKQLRINERTVSTYKKNFCIS